MCVLFFTFRSDIKCRFCVRVHLYEKEPRRNHEREPVLDTTFYRIGGTDSWDEMAVRVGPTVRDKWQLGWQLGLGLGLGLGLEWQLGLNGS